MYSNNPSDISLETRHFFLRMKQPCTTGLRVVWENYILKLRQYSCTRQRKVQTKHPSTKQYGQSEVNWYCKSWTQIASLIYSCLKNIEIPAFVRNVSLSPCVYCCLFFWMTWTFRPHSMFTSSLGIVGWTPRTKKNPSRHSEKGWDNSRSVILVHFTWGIQHGNQNQTIFPTRYSWCWCHRSKKLLIHSEWLLGFSILRCASFFNLWIRYKRVCSGDEVCYFCSRLSVMCPPSTVSQWKNGSINEEASFFKAIECAEAYILF